MGKLHNAIINGTIENVIIDALEGGSNYWYHLDIDDIIKSEELVPNENKSISSAEVLAKAIMEHGLELPVYDKENTHDLLGIFSKAKLEDGWLALDEENDDVMDRIAEEQYDSDDADVFFQCVTMGKVVF